MAPAKDASTSGDHAEAKQPEPDRNEPDRNENLARARENALDIVEVAAAVLVRNFELLRRRGDAYLELDRAEYLLLRTLDQAGPLDIGTVAAALGLDPSTAGRQVAAMQTKGLVRRHRAPADRRRSIIGTTQKGRRLMAKVRERRRQATADLLSHWTGDEVRLLARMFTRYNQTVAQRYLVPARTENVPTASPVASQILLPG